MALTFVASPHPLQRRGLKKGLDIKKEKPKSSPLERI